MEPGHRWHLRRPRPQDQCGQVDRHPRRPGLRFAFAASRLCGGLCVQGLEGEIREGLCRGLDQGDERRSVRRRLIGLTQAKQKRAAERPPFAFAGRKGLLAGGFASRSSPVCWSTAFIDKRVLPRSSKPSSLTLTLSPSLTTSEVFCTRLAASWLMWTRPSMAPNSITLTTVPS